VDLASVSARIGHCALRTTAEIYSHGIRGKDRLSGCPILLQQPLNELHVYGERSAQLPHFS
jgi:hypothetical protein